MSRNSTLTCGDLTTCTCDSNAQFPLDTINLNIASVAFLIEVFRSLLSYDTSVYYLRAQHLPPAASAAT